MFFTGFNNPFMIFILIMLIGENISYYVSTPGAFLALVLSIPGMLIAITFHEFAHAWVADKLGDDTPRRQGRLNLNPLSHLDPVGVILLLTAGFGWGKPVQINPNNFNRTVSLRKGNALVSLAGPVINFILAIIFSVIYGLLLAFCSNFLLTTAGGILATVIQYTISINVGLGVFNLIPLPPLDGSKVLVNFLPYNARRWFLEKETVFHIIFLVIWITGLTSYIVSPALEFLSSGMIKIAFAIFGL